ncbi:MAG: ribonuclease H-like domain-containing protein, partial [Bacteroidota bacterium]
EPAVLAESRRLLVQADLVVSYNGITFDVPYLRNRLRFHKLGKLELPTHLDLLPVARAKLGRSLGNCKLQTLEQHLCRRERCNDIPGAQIPQAYHDFVADGDAGRICRIIEHNAFDVITLAELTAHLAVRT